MKSLVDIASTDLGDLCNKRTKKDLLVISVAYLTHGIDASAFRNRMWKVIESDGFHLTNAVKSVVEVYRKHITRDYYLILNFAYTALHVLAHDGVNFVKECRKYGLHDLDVKLIRSIKNDGFLRNTSIGVIKRRGYSNPNTILHSCTEQVQKLPLVNLVRKKLRFVTMYNGLDHDDLLYIVGEYVLCKLIWSYDATKSYEHARNHALMVMHNALRNLASSQSCTRTLQGIKRGDETVRRYINLSEMANTDEDVAYMLDSILPATCYAEAELEQQDTNKTANSVFATYGTNPKKIEFLRILAGIRSTKFNTWLGENNIKEHDLEDPAYLIVIAAEYLNVEPGVARKFVQDIRFDLRSAA